MTSFSISPTEAFTITTLVVWTLFWKGWALWKSARRSDGIWFGVLLVLNTAGILEILYIFVFSKREDKATKESA